MRLYSGTTSMLIEDTTYNRISTKLSDAFFQELRYHPSQSEVNSWRESLRAMAQVFQAGKLLDNGVMLELQLPNSSMRLDCLVTGKDERRRDSAVIVELKQWEESE